MSNFNKESSVQAQTLKSNTSKRLPYRKPEVHSLGSLEQVQGSSRGSYSEPYGYYSG